MPSGPWISGMCAMTGTVPAERLVDLRLARGIGEVIVAADDVGDAHVVVVDHDREHVGRRAVRAQQHEVVEVLVLPDDAALHLVLDHGLAGERRLEADHRLRRRAALRRDRGRASGRRRAWRGLRARAFSRISVSSSGLA